MQVDGDRGPAGHREVGAAVLVHGRRPGLGVPAFDPDLGPTGRPTVAERIDALVNGTLEHPPRAGGRCTVLHTGGHPSAIGHWGVTAD